jgi:hypothetical protein
VIKARMMTLAGHEECTGATTNTYKTWSENLKETNHFEDQRADEFIFK